MKIIRLLPLFLLLTLLAACKPSMNTILSTKPCVKGVVQEVHEQMILIEVNEDEEARKTSDLISVSLDVKNADSITHFYAGDEVAVYYDGQIAESYPAQIHTVYAITLIEGSDARQEAEKQVDA